MKILLAEDDGALAGQLFHLLVKNGYQTTAVKTGQAALDEVGRSYFDMVIAEACTPAVDGCALVRSLRAAGSPTPVLLLTERAHGEAMHQAFLSGAHDCLVKPVDDNELLLRITALQRRTQTGGERCRIIGGTVIDYDALSVSFDGQSLTLPLKEFLILYKLCAAPGRIISRQQLMDDIWGYENDADTHTIDVHISRLRSRLRHNRDLRIETVRGIGYRVERCSARLNDV